MSGFITMEKHKQISLSYQGAFVLRLLQWIIQRKVFVILLTVFIILVGSYALFNLEKELNPAVALDAASIDIETTSLNVEDIERKITNPLEQRIQEIDGIKSILSTTSSRHSSVQVVFENGKGNELFNEIESKSNAVLSNIPEIESIEVNQEGINTSFEFIFDISEGDLDKMSTFAKDILKPRIEELPEVREVRLTGLIEHEVDIEFNKKKLTEKNLTINEVIEIIQQGNSNEVLGDLTAERESSSLRWNTTIDNLDELKELRIPTDNSFTNLDKIATVTTNPIESSSNTWKNGTKDLIMVEVGRQDGTSQSDMTQAVRHELNEIQKDGLIDGFKLNETIAHADFVNDSLKDVTINILIGGLVAIIVLLLFLNNFRATLIISLSIPISILLTMIAMSLLGYTINLLTLIGLGLGIGMMVDSSIVILESIYRKKQEGFSNIDAVLKGTKEVSTAIIAAVLTTVVVFLPIGFIGGDTGKFMIILAVVVTVTLISSVIIAFTLIPTLTMEFMKLRKQNNEAKKSKFIFIYKDTVLWCIKKKSRSLFIIVAFLLLFTFSLFLVPKIPMNIMPDMFNRYSEIVVDLENGVSQKEKAALVKKINQKLSPIDDIEAHYLLDFDDKMIANIVMTKGKNITEEQDIVTEEVLGALRELKGTEPIRAVERALEGVSDYPIQVNISGGDFTNLNEITNIIEKDIKSIEGIVGVTNTGSDIEKIEIIQLKEDKIKELGISDLQIKQQIEEFLLQTSIGTVKWGNEELRLNARWDRDQYKKEDLLQTKISTPTGEEKLSTFINFKQENIPSVIRHKDGDRFISIMADLEDTDLGTVNKEIQKVIDRFENSSDYSISVGGNLEDQNQLMNELLIVLGLALFLVFVVMALQFNHFGHPLIVMAIIPVTIVGVILGLVATQAELNFMSGIGLIILIGIVLNNAILIIDRTNQLRKKGLSVVQSLIQAGENRIRPIFMTTLTTVGGMFPLALATGMSADYQAPLAIVIISGLLFSTLITLLLIPSIYRLFSGDS